MVSDREDAFDHAIHRGEEDLNAARRLRVRQLVRARRVVGRGSERDGGERACLDACSALNQHVQLAGQLVARGGPQRGLVVREAIKRHLLGVLAVDAAVQIEHRKPDHRGCWEREGRVHAIAGIVDALRLARGTRAAVHRRARLAEAAAALGVAGRDLLSRAQAVARFAVARRAARREDLHAQRHLRVGGKVDARKGSGGAVE